MKVEAWKRGLWGQKEAEDWSSQSMQEDIDPVVVMKAGGGKKSGCHYLFDGSISTSSHPNLSELRA
jgi:hypothetical protein